MFGSMDGTTADFFKYMDKVYRKAGTKREPGQTQRETLKALTLLKLFAKYRLMNDIKPDPDEEWVQRVKRKNTYPRFVLTADLLAAWKRISGREPMATATVENGERRVSPAIEFLSIALPPIFS